MGEVYESNERTVARAGNPPDHSNVNIPFHLNRDSPR